MNMQTRRQSRAHTHKHTHTHTNACTHTHTHNHMHIHEHTIPYRHIHAPTHTYNHTCVQSHAHTHTHTHTHNHMHIHPHAHNIETLLKCTHITQYQITTNLGWVDRSDWGLRGVGQGDIPRLVKWIIASRAGRSNHHGTCHLRAKAHCVQHCQNLVLFWERGRVEL